MVVCLGETVNWPQAMQTGYLRGETDTTIGHIHLAQLAVAILLKVTQVKGPTQGTEEAELAANTCLSGSTVPLFWSTLSCWLYPLLSEKRNQ